MGMGGGYVLCGTLMIIETWEYVDVLERRRCSSWVTEISRRDIVYSSF